MAIEYNSLSDSELLTIISKGKPESDLAFKYVYKRYSSKIHAYCFKLVSDRTQAEDIFQETFIKFYQKACVHNGNGTVSGFLFTIARNLCFNYNRDKKKTIDLEDFHLFYENTELEQRESQQLVNLAIDLLEIEFREPLILRMYDGLSYNEIAEICSITPENARKRVFRAKEKIKKILEPYYRI